MRASPTTTSKNPRARGSRINRSLHFAGEEFGSIVAVDLADERVVIKTVWIELACFWNRGLLQHGSNRFGIHGHVSVPDFDAFLMTFLEDFGIRDFCVLGLDLVGERGIFNRAFEAVEVSH